MRYKREYLIQYSTSGEVIYLSIRVVHSISLVRTPPPPQAGSR